MDNKLDIFRMIDSEDEAILKRFTNNADGPVNLSVEELIKSNTGVEGTMADMRSVLWRLINEDLICFDFDMRYLKLATLGRLYLYDGTNEVLRPAPESKYGDRIALHKFMIQVEQRCILDYDGTGYYGTYDKVSNIYVNCDVEELLKAMQINAFNYIHWYNK